MESEIQLGSVRASVVFKQIKNVHLSVYPPTGHVRISAPERMSIDHIRAYAASKLPWIKSQQKKILSQERETQREFLTGESHYLWGARYLMVIHEAEGTSKVELRGRHLHFHVRPGWTLEKKADVLDQWYREQVRLRLDPLLVHWQKTIGVEVDTIHVRRMKTKWGSCSPSNRTIRINTELAKKPAECLEYILVHELIHLLEPTHNQRFVGFLDQFLPSWRSHKARLNQLPVRHESWKY